MLDALIQDTRYTLRWLLRSPGFALVAILSLGARNRVQHRDFCGRRRPAPAAAAGAGAGAPRRHLHERRRRRHLLEQFPPGHPRLSAKQRRLCRPCRLLADVCRRQPRRPLAPGARRSRHRQLLLDAGRRCAPGANVSARRRRAVGSENGRSVESLLAARVRGRSRRARPEPAHSRPAVHHHRRARRQLHRHGSAAGARDLGAGEIRGRDRACRHQ